MAHHAWRKDHSVATSGEVGSLWGVAHVASVRKKQCGGEQTPLTQEALLVCVLGGREYGGGNLTPVRRTGKPQAVGFSK